ncbi:MAG: hypothetical protein IPP42_20625 [Saprospiraceae bacterium]|nr:hypothetical protein [Saprospiraceae bacterium]
MVFSRLNFGIILLIAGCSMPVKSTFAFEGRIIGEDKIFDKILLNVTHKGKAIAYKVIGSSYIKSDSFEIVESSGYLELNSFSCAQKNNKIQLLNEFKNNIKCPSFYPFYLETITLIAEKDITLEENKYHIFKLFNESYSQSSVTFWLQGFGILFIKLEEGKYYIISEAKNVNSPWKDILNELKKDLDFIELRPIPEPPPVPEVD